MKSTATRRDFVLGSAAAAGALSLAGRHAFAADPLKVGFVYVGPVGDYGWTHGHDLGRKAMVTHFGDKVKTTFVESVTEGPDAERVIRQLASSGHGLVFATSFGFMNPTLRVAKQFPKVKFEHATGYQTSPNVSVYNARFHEGRVVCGTIAGRVSKSGVAGYIGSFPIPEVVMGINAFALAARKIRPDFKVKVVWANSWYDPGKEADGAKALVDQGVDIMCQHTDSPAPLQVAETRGIHGFGQASDMKPFAPNAQLTAILDVWDGYYIQRAQDIMDGTWKSHSIWWGLEEGMVKMAPYGPAVPEAVAREADAVREAIIAGTRHPFTGPIKDQKGALRVADGETLSEKEIAAMDWYVEGVEA